uniref:Uncharacterized protein n=1 Tax=Cacopsylla melanoneura TaxID=428564 RepID=A0A8D8TS21_9HEMI
MQALGSRGHYKFVTDTTGLDKRRVSLSLCKTAVPYLTNLISDNQTNIRTRVPKLQNLIQVSIFSEKHNLQDMGTGTGFRELYYLPTRNSYTTNDKTDRSVLNIF